MEEIKGKQKVLDRLNELKIKGLGCAFCGTSSREFEAYPYILDLDGVKVI